MIEEKMREQSIGERGEGAAFGKFKVYQECLDRLCAIQWVHPSLDNARINPNHFIQTCIQSFAHVPRKFLFRVRPQQDG